MPVLAEKIARLLALLGLIGALLAPAVPSFAAAAPVEPGAVHAAMGCDGAADPSGNTHRQGPAHHLPGPMDCCVANVCAMTLALPAAPSGVALSAPAERATYDLRPLQQPAGISTAPIPHPPKSAA